MTADFFDSNTQNNDIGIVATASGRVTVNEKLEQMATILKVGTAGDVIWENSLTGEVGVYNLEAGEPFIVAFDKIVSAATVHGVAETTTATNMFWVSSSARVGRKD